MRELKENEIQEVNGGFFVSAAWIAIGAYRAYRTYKAVRTAVKVGAGMEAGYQYSKYR
jgi:uncharacterized membrane protein (UPF0136 family)